MDPGNHPCQKLRIARGGQIEPIESRSHQDNAQTDGNEMPGNIPALEATREVSRQRMKKFAHDLKWNTVANGNADTDVKGVEQGRSTKPSSIKGQPKPFERTDFAPNNGLAALMVNSFYHLSPAVLHKSDLRIHHFPKILSLRLGKNLAVPAGELCEEMASLTRHSQHAEFAI